ncbi:MAG TPA: NAD(P)-dependent oxidoreductase [Fibrobacteria bacterium]|nr:NAD(P)-dependent oxidoreductase [Fibrobacteria bacterium]
MDSGWKGRICLVTGAAGFGGSHLCAALVERGAKVVGFDRWSPRNSFLALSGTIDRIDWIQGDVRDVDLLKQALERFDVATVFHLAAQPIVPISNTLPMETFSVNAMGAMAVLEAIRLTGNRRDLVFASSGAYYGATTTDEPIAEEHPPLPAMNTYAPSKVAADEMVRSYARIFGTRAAVCRFMNTFGEGDSNFTRLVPRAARNLALAEPYDFGDRDDGSTQLDFLHISDMTRAYIALAENLDAGIGEAFNIGSGRGRSTAEIARAASLAWDGTERTPLFGGPARSTPIVKYLDTSKAERILGWKPAVPLQEALERTMKWYKDNWSAIA